jgi:hypothetical protein
MKPKNNLAGYVYAIREKGTGLYLPNSEKGHSSSSEFSFSSIRLFSKKAFAENTLTWWLRGKCEENSGNEAGNFNLKYNLIPPRNRDNIEIVKFALVEVDLYHD